MQSVSPQTTATCVYLSIYFKHVVFCDIKLCLNDTLMIHWIDCSALFLGMLAINSPHASALVTQILCAGRHSLG